MHPVTSKRWCLMFCDDSNGHPLQSLQQEVIADIILTGAELAEHGVSPATLLPQRSLEV